MLPRAGNSLAPEGSRLAPERNRLAPEGGAQASDDAIFNHYRDQYPLRRKSRSEMRLCDVGQVDDFDLFLAQAGRRKLSNSNEFGGSLPCFSGPARPAPACMVDNKLSKTSTSKCFGSPVASRLLTAIRKIVHEGDTSPELRHHDKCQMSRVNSEPPSRQSSVRKKPLQKSYSALQSSSIRPRTSSVPARGQLQRPNTLDLEHPPTEGAQTFEGWYKVRQLQVTPRGIVNRGDSVKSGSLRSLGSCGSSSAAGSAASLSPRSATPVYKVLLLGAPGVGKTTLSTQFRTSETMGGEDADHENQGGNCVSVILDEEEAVLDILDLQPDENLQSQGDTDAYVVVFSIEDKTSFRTAVDLLFELRMSLKRTSSIILVANKADLVRCRQVSIKEAKAVAETYDCKYAEVSGLLNLQMDELLGGILRQIQLRQLQTRQSPLKPYLHDLRSSKTVINRLFRKQHSVSRSCDNLLV